MLVMPEASASARQLVARAAAHLFWPVTEDRSARTAPARSAFLTSFEAKVDPEGLLLPAERHRRAENARRAHFLQLAAKSADARRCG